MRYKGDNELFFSTDNEKNVTVVLGDNTFGKTTLAQAFRWGLYESLNDTSYNKKKDVVLLNNEAAAELKSGVEKVFVEIVVINQEEEIRFMRTATFNRKNVLSSDISVKQIGPTELTMQLKDENGIWGDVIPNSGKEVKREVNGNVIKEKYVNGCVQDKIDNIFPQSLSNYFFFDGERWNDLKSKTSDIKKSIYTILGVSGLIEMMNHLKDGSYNNVEKSFRAKVKGVSGEYKRLFLYSCDILLCCFTLSSSDSYISCCLFTSNSNRSFSRFNFAFSARSSIKNITSMFIAIRLTITIQTNCISF